MQKLEWRVKAWLYQEPEIMFKILYYDDNLDLTRHLPTIILSSSLGVC